MTETPRDSRSPLARQSVILGGLFAGAALILSAPGAGIAHAHGGHSTESGQAVGRDGFDNPAPGVRLSQAVGDHVFNDKTTFNRALNESQMGQNYHERYGTPNYEDHIHGSNGTRVGLLNEPGLREWYDGLQDAGLGLPGEEDLPGTVVRRVSGVQPSTGSGNGHGDEVEFAEGDDDAYDDPGHGTHLLAAKETAIAGDCTGTSSSHQVTCDTHD